MGAATGGAVRWDQVTALFGGTFDPPHLGHREAVRGLFERPRVRAVRVVPSPIPPHKTSYAPTEHRMALAKLGFASSARDPIPTEVTLDFRELDRARNAPRMPSYTFDTLQEVRREIAEIAFVIGADQLRLLPTWHRFPEILGLSHWIVLGRKPQGEGVARETLREWVASGLVRPARDGDTWTVTAAGGKTSIGVMSTSAPAISSTAIREQIARTGSPPSDTLMPEVEAYLKLHRIYGMRAK